HQSNAVVAVEALSLANLHLATDSAMPALMGEMREAFSIPHFTGSSTFTADLAAGSIGNLTSAHGAMVSPTELLAGSDMVAGQMALPMLASNIAMPNAAALMALAGTSNAHSTISVEHILVEALHGGASNGPDINALLNALPSQANGANAGPDIMASLGGNPVPTWDTGHGAAFTFAATNAITSEALVLHHDAIQPIANG
ncbi:MAG: hypothetical protein ABIR87_02950, partial [Sphingomicrobium sp.]